MSRRAALFAVLTAAALSLGAKGDFRARRDYEHAAEDATRELFIHWRFETALILRGTYLTPSFREALAGERRRLLNPTEADHQAWTAALLDDGTVYHEVVFSADSGMEGGDVFGAAKDGWTVRLTADGVEEPLVTLFPVREPTMLQRSLYPHVNPWSDLWIARFRKTVAGPQRVVFEVGGGYGHGELVWDELR